ncbi:MAG: YhcH/YjgK/YiaL family protein [Bacteroidales bacterium]|nr:YhcH/YjgK/YiaL family protein [Bacteroidales bacterium]
MKRLKFLTLLLCATFLVAQAGKQSCATKKQLQWYNQKAWLQGIAPLPDPSIDIAAFAKHYQKHPERWDLVFKFMKENDLKTLPLGKQVLSEDVSINVQEYTSKDPGEERFEGHRANIDLQYVVSGKELIGVANINDAKEVVPFDAKKDYAGFLISSICYHTATPERFFIFFPANIHLPGVQYGEKTPIRKVVFKIKVD